MEETTVIEQPQIQQVEIVERPIPDAQEQMEEILLSEQGEDAKHQAKEASDADDSNPLHDESTINENKDTSNDDQNKTDLDASEDQDQDDSKWSVDKNEEVTTLSSLHDLADNLGVDVSELYNINIPVTNPDGSKQEVSIGQWKDQVQTTLRKGQQYIANEMQQRQGEIDQAKAYYQQQIQQSSALVGAMENELAGNINNIDWGKLRSNDPAEYAALVQDVENRKSQIMNYKQQVVQQSNQQNQIQSNQQNHMNQQRLQVENQQMMTAKPEWINQERAQTEKTAISSYLVDKAGFSPEEAGSIVDHRFVLMAEKAMKYEQIDKAAPNRKRVVKIGNKTVKPGASKSNRQKSADNFATTKRKAMSGDTNAQEAYFQSLLQ